VVSPSGTRAVGVNFMQALYERPSRLTAPHAVSTPSAKPTKIDTDTRELP